MYVRFVCAMAHPTLDAELGMFSARDYIDFSELKGSLQRADDEVFEFFSSIYGWHPPRISGKRRNRKIRKSLFWIKENATFWSNGGSVVTRARELAHITTLAGIEIREIRMQNPGEIIWEDYQQALIYPNGITVPKAF